MDRRIKTIMIKDLKQIIGNRQVWLPMVLVSVMFSVFLPILIFALARFTPHSINGMDLLLKKIPGGMPYKDEVKTIIYVSVKYLFPSYFIMIPLMTGSLLGAGSFVGEREKNTLESLFYTPLTVKQLFWAKLLGVFLPAYAVALLSFVLFGIVVNVGGWMYFGGLIFPDALWVILIFWLSPVLTMFGLSFLVLLSARFRTYQEAMQMSGLLVLPFLVVIFGQTAGLFFLQSWMLLVAGAVILLFTIILIRLGIRGFDPEKLV